MGLGRGDQGARRRRCRDIGDDERHRDHPQPPSARRVAAGRRRFLCRFSSTMSLTSRRRRFANSTPSRPPRHRIYGRRHLVLRFDESLDQYPRHQNPGSFLSCGHCHRNGGRKPGLLSFAFNCSGPLNAILRMVDHHGVGSRAGEKQHVWHRRAQETPFHSSPDGYPGYFSSQGLRKIYHRSYRGSPTSRGFPEIFQESFHPGVIGSNHPALPGNRAQMGSITI